jgi:hypothetical protein
MELQQVTYDVSRLYLQDRKHTLPEPVYLKLHGKIRARDFQYLGACVSDSTLDVTGVEAVRTLRQLEAFFKKNSAFTDKVSTRLAALISFEKGEELCKETNERLDTFYSKHHGEIHDDFRLKVQRCQVYIQKVLGNHREFLEQLPKLLSVTSGATTTRSRRRSIPFLKVSKRLVCTPGAWPYIQSLSDYFGYGFIQARLINRNRVTFVPKSWKTERTIACEPEGNMALQLAFDKYAKRRLSRVGIDLRDQTRNQELAKEGSIFDSYSTIDLSMASDTLSYNTVALLFPEEWFQYLRAIRSQKYSIYPGQDEDYHKFSSMGNGSTFPVETLVFAAACSAVGSSSFSVYGDDIIIEQDRAEQLIELLAYLGFVPNTEKSYISGPFRESCGTDWYKGFLLTPFYIRDADSRKATWCHLVNGLMTIADPCGVLMPYLADIVCQSKLPLAPYNEDSMGGVWVDTHTAYSMKLITVARRGRYAWRPRVRLYKPKPRRFANRDTRSLFLWYLKNTGRQQDFLIPKRISSRFGRRHVSDPSVGNESSLYDASSHKYVRKWVHWYPVVGEPDHLYSWSELVTLKLEKS